MSEQEKKDVAGMEGTSVVMVEQGGGGHKPYRPTDLQDEPPDLPQKRTRAPAVPAAVVLTDKLKNASENSSFVEDNSERKEKESIPLENYKQNFGKKISTNTERRQSPTNITVTNVELESKNISAFSSALQPIPAEVESCKGVAEKSGAASLEEKKSIVGKSEPSVYSVEEDIATLPSAEAARHSEWLDVNESIVNESPESDKDLQGSVIETQTEDQKENKETATSSSLMNGKKISWNDETRDSEIDKALFLESKPSLGPLKIRTSFEAASGILINIPKRSMKNIRDDNINFMQSGINITISKRCLASNSKSRTNLQQSPNINAIQETRSVLVEPRVPLIKYFGAFQGKYNFMRNKFKNVFNV